MSQGLVHNQPLLYASPSKDPRGFLGTLPSPVLSKDDKSHNRDPDQVSLYFTFLFRVVQLSGFDLLSWVNIKN